MLAIMSHPKYADIRPRLTGPDGRSVELPEPMFEVLLQVLLESGVIPFDKPSRNRKVRLDDLLEYRRRQRSQAGLAFAEMTADAERMSLYGVDHSHRKVRPGDKREQR